MRPTVYLLPIVIIFSACGGFVTQVPVSVAPGSPVSEDTVPPVEGVDPPAFENISDAVSEADAGSDEYGAAVDYPPGEFADFDGCADGETADSLSDDAATDNLSCADGGSESLALLEGEEPQLSVPVTDREIPCIHSFDELLAAVPGDKMAQLSALFLENLAFDHPHVRAQFSSWYGGCKAQAKLHRALDRGDQIYFPIVEEQARAHFPESLGGTTGETPLLEVLKALTVVESLVNTNAISFAGAGGPWQFMRGTYSRIAKRIGDEDPYPAEDMRFDWAAASRAAFELTQENLRAFQWTKSPLACAIMAYNGGISRVSQALKRQNRLDCRQLKYTKYSTKTYIATETYFYQPRIVMVLLVMYWRQANGYSLPALPNYQPVVLKGEGAIRLQDLAQKAGVDYQELLKNNRRYPLGITPMGSWQLAVSEDQLPQLTAALPQVDQISDERIKAMLQKAAPLDIVLLLGDGAFRYYKVRPGDNVSKICQRFNISRSRLYQLNKGLFAQNKRRSHGHDWVLYVGQRLRLPGLDQLILQ